MAAPAGKDKRKFVVVKDGVRSYQIQGEKGGQVPDSLGGMWTNIAMAERQIKLYITTRDKPKRTYRPTKPKGDLSGRTKNKS